MDDKCTGDVPDDDFAPREYQVELFQAALQENTIVCLGTGTGKTFIAVMLIKEMEQKIRVPFEKGGKRTFFLVPSVPLVVQQKNAIQRHTSLRVGGYIGAMGVDNWDKNHWQEEFHKMQVLVMTAEIFKIIVTHGFLPFSRVNLVVVDECHKAVKKHTYREIFRCLDVVDPADRPRVLGLTASVINDNTKDHQVMPKIKNLEKSLYCRVMTAENPEVMAKYGTKPQEIVVLYRNHSFHLDFSGINTEKKISREERLVEKRMRELTSVWKELGPWCTRLACDLLIEEGKRELERTEQDSRAEILEYLSQLEILSRKLEASMVPCRGEENELLKNASPKLRKLLEILSHFRPASQDDASRSNGVQQDELCGIIFVEQRCMAQVLTRWLTKVAEELPGYAFLRPQFIVGHGSLTKGLQEAGMTFSKQCKVMAGFRSHNYNLLVATAVVEEGMDVPRCNLVVRFDKISDFRSYIQSKGRARARRSFFILMVCEELRGNAIIQLANNISIEKNLLDKLHGRAVPNVVESQASFLKDEILPAYMPVVKDGAARVTVGTSIALVNRYCGMLPSDIFTTLRPSYTITGSSGRFVCTVYLPMSSPLKEPIKGEEMETKKAAKMAAALKTCQRLHEIGELDDNMIPIKRVINLSEDTEDEKEEEVPAGTAKPGTKKRRRHYKKKVCRLFQNGHLTPTVVHHLHVLTSQLVHLASEVQNWRKEKLIDPEDTSLWFGFLLKERMPTLPTFPIFTRSGEELVTVFYAGTTYLSQEQCALAEKFHRNIFDEVLRMQNRKILHFDLDQSLNGVTVIPVTLDDSCAMIDWSFINMTLNYTKRDISEKFVFRKHDYENAVVIPHYKPPNYRYNSFYVKKVREDIVPDCEWMKGEGTIREYEELMHDRKITDPTQPLLEVGFTEYRLNMLTPRYANRKGDTFVKKTGTDRLVLRLAEFCDIHPFQAPVWRKVVCLPSILYRLGQLLVVEEMRVAVTESTGVGVAHGVGAWPTLDYQCVVPGSSVIEANLEAEKVVFGTLLRDHGSTHVVQMPRISKSFEYQPKLDGNPGPSPGLLLEALTWAKAGDGFDLERLEVLGDSFLKFVVTIDLFCSQTSAQEGLLTEARARIISNRNLHRLACRLHIGECIASTMFEPNLSWLPPGYVMPADVEDMLLDISFVCWMLRDSPKKLESVTADQIRIAYAQYKSVTSTPEYVAAPNDVSGPVPTCLTTQLADKGVADSVEAIIGSYLLVCGPIGAIKVMKWLGLKLSQCNLAAETSQNGEPNTLEEGTPRSFLGFTPPTTALVGSGADSCKELGIELQRLATTVAEVESALGYTFRDRSFLLQAVTHASYFKNRLTDCYQRLEFLGDAVIDYLVTRYIYEGPCKFNPGQLTDLRSSLVNNSFFASLVVKYGLHGCLKHCNVGLFSAISRFVEYQSMTDTLSEDDDVMMDFGDDGLLDLNKEVKSSLDETDFHKKLYFEELECQEPEEVEVPKALGDLFESLIGAVFLDCGMSLDRVWHVIYRMFGREIECFSKNVPLPPIRTLLETYPDARFSQAEILPSGKVKVELHVRGQSFSSIAKSKKLAKSTLAKKCLRVLRRNTKPSGP